MAVWKEINLPVEGMTCGGCASNVTRALQALPGVAQASVDLAERRAVVRFDAAQVDVMELKHAVSDAGYRVPTRTAALKVDGMSCMSCVGRIDGALTGLDGVLEADVSLTKGRVDVRYIPGLVSVAEMEQAVTRAGYPAAAIEEHPVEELPGGEAGGEKVFKAAWIGKAIKRAGR